METLYYSFSLIIVLLIVISPLAIMITLFYFLFQKSPKEKSSEVNFAYRDKFINDIITLKSRGKIDGKTYNNIVEFLDETYPLETTFVHSESKKVEKKQQPKEIFKKIEKSEINLETKEKEANDSISSSIVSKFSANLLLYLGSLMIIFSALILVIFSWSQLSESVRASILPFFMLGFVLFGVIFYQFKKIRSGGITFLTISSMLFPLSLAGIWRFVLDDIEIMSFWQYWFGAGIIWIGIGIIYHKFLNNIVSRLLILLSLNTFLFSISFFFDVSVQLKFLLLFLSNSLVVFFSKYINDKFLSNGILLISNAIMAFVVFISFFVIYLDVEEKYFSYSGVSQILYILVVNLNIILPVIYLCVAYFRNKNLFYFVFISAALYVQICFFGSIWEISVVLVLFLLSSLSIVLWVSSYLFKYLGRIKEFQVLMSYSILLSIATYLLTILFDLSSSISMISTGLIFLTISIFNLFVYTKEDRSILLLIFSSMLIYPIIRFIGFGNIQILNGLEGISILFISFMLFLIAIGLKLFRSQNAAFSFIVSFYIINLVGIFGLFINQIGFVQIGLLLLLNAFIYMLTSIFIFNGRVTQISIVWILLSLGFTFLQFPLGFIYLVYAASAFLAYFAFGVLRKVDLGQKSILIKNLFDDLNKTIIIYLIIVVPSITFLLMFSRGVYSLLAVFLITIMIYIAMYLERIFLFIVPLLLVLYILILKTFDHTNISPALIPFAMFVVSLVFYAFGYSHLFIKHLSKRFANFESAYLRFGLLNLLFTFIVISGFLRGYENYRFIYFALELLIISLVLAQSIIRKSKLLSLLPSLMVTYFIWDLGIYFGIENAQLYSLTFALALHKNSIIVNSSKLNKLFVDAIGFSAMTIVLSTSILMSVSNNIYLIVLIIQGLIYLVIWPVFKRRNFSIFAFVFVVLGIVINFLGVLVTFPQWITLGCVGLLVLLVAIIFLFLNKEK